MDDGQRHMNLRAEQKLASLAISLPPPPKPMGAYVESIQIGNLLFLSGTMPTEGGVPQFQGRIGDTLSVDDARRAARLAALNALALAKAHLKSLNRVRRVIRLGVLLVTTPEFNEHPKVADSASELLVELFGFDKISTRHVYGVHSLPLGLCVEIEMLFEVAAHGEAS